MSGTSVPKMLVPFLYYCKAIPEELNIQLKLLPIPKSKVHIRLRLGKRPKDYLSIYIRIIGCFFYKRYLHVGVVYQKHTLTLIYRVNICISYSDVIKEIINNNSARLFPKTRMNPKLQLKKIELYFYTIELSNN